MTEARIAEAVAKNSPHDAHASKVATAARERAARSPLKPAPALAKSAPRTNFKPSESLKNRYREVAKAVHPDLATDDDERARRHRFMVDANEAYNDGDQSRLEAILHAWHAASPEAVKGDGVGAELIRTIRKLAQISERLIAIEPDLRRRQRNPHRQTETARRCTAEAEGYGSYCGN